MAEEAHINVVEFTVSELSAALKRTVEDTYGYVRVRGEVTGYKGPHGSGHVYFALKDENAKIDAVIWKGVFGRMRVKPAEGLEVIVTGKLTTYPNRSSYQIIVETLEPAGLGALMALLEERKKKLAAEGLFDAARKQLLPFLPTVIGVVTSPTGAVIRDILHRLADRFPRRVVVWPVRVQGEGAAEQVAAAIRGFNALPAKHPVPRPDLIIVARGGGSLEDLWAFNEEIVVRAAAESLIPLISAVGHETDITLIDFASDRRAPTPTAAAEMAVPVRAELIAAVMSLTGRALSSWQRSQEARRAELRSAARSLPRAKGLIENKRQQFDACVERLPRALRANAHQHERRYRSVAALLSPETLRAHLRLERSRLTGATERGRNAMAATLERRRERFRALNFVQRAQRAFALFVDQNTKRVERATGLLKAFSYQGVLARGFALVRDAAGHPLRAAAAVSPGMALDIEFADGRVAAIADGESGAPGAAPSKPRTRRSGGEGQSGGQGSLFGA